MIAEATRKTLHVPLITGYIFAGIVCGPHALKLLTEGDTRQLQRIINDDAMGFIGFSAGSKFLLSELADNVKQIVSLLVGLVATTYFLVFVGLNMASPASW